MAARVEKQARRWTYEEFCQLHEDQRCEILQLNSSLLAGLEFGLPGG
jgi:hypothetical protein